MLDKEISQWKSIVLSRLIQWRRKYDLLNKETQRMQDVLLVPPESPLIEAAYSVFDSYTECLSEVIGDKDEWLVWYCWENNMGERKFGVYLDGEEKERPIESLEDLADLIWDCAAK